MRRERWGVKEGAGPPPQKKIMFCPKNNVWCILAQFLTGRKQGQPLKKPWNTDLTVQKRSLQKTVAKTIQKYF